jgi:hypothetical protein
MRRPRLSYANVTATLALVVAMAGGAYAAGLGKNAVKSRNIAPGAVKTSDLGKKAVKTAKIAPNAVTGAQVNEATLGTVPRAADSDLLDGIDSAAFLRGSGHYRAVIGSDAVGGAPSAPVQMDLGTLTLECRNPASVGSDFVFTNTSGASADVWTDKVQSATTPLTSETYAVVPNQGTVTISVSGPAVTGGALVRFEILAGQQVTLVEARIASDATGCRFPLLISELHG